MSKVEPADEYIPIKFISEEITVQFAKKPVLSKKPSVPDSFIRGEKEHEIAALISEWYDFERRGRMAMNMQEPHLREAARRGSWGVGRFYFRIRTSEDLIFDMYYDRAPESAADREGHWFLWRELKKR